jgi:regulatory protein PHO2
VDLTPPDKPPLLAPGRQDELQNLLLEDERRFDFDVFEKCSNYSFFSPAVNIIPCTALAIGEFRRIAQVSGQFDLVAYLCEGRRSLTWFIHTAGRGFKMEIPYEIVRDTAFMNSGPGTGVASFVLSRPPLFFCDHNMSLSSPSQRQWRPCEDWTEGRQASKVLKHDLSGSAMQVLVSVLTK